MRYENRQPAEGINVTHEHPLRQFARLIVAVSVLVAVLTVVLRFGGAWLARQVPFATEQRIVQSLDIDFGNSKTTPELQAYLSDLAARLAANMPVPEGMTFDIHYKPGEVFNAYATLGGNLLFYKGLLEKMPHENALAMVMAHEIAHVVYRDPPAALGGGVTSMAALMVVTGNAGAAGGFISAAGGVTGLNFTRDMENTADAAAVEALAGHYGHLGGADELFRRLQQKRKDGSSPRWMRRFLSTHPLDADRIERIAELAHIAGVPASGQTTALPDEFDQWLH